MMYALWVFLGLSVFVGVLVGILTEDSVNGWITGICMGLIGGFIVARIGLAISQSTNWRDLPLTIVNERVYFNDTNGKNAAELKVVSDANGYYTLLQVSAGSTYPITSAGSLLFHGNDFYYETITKRLPAGFWHWQYTQTATTLVLPEKFIEER